MDALRQAWWGPLAGLLVVAQVALLLTFVFGDGTSNVLDVESRVAGSTLSLVGAVSLVLGLWCRPRARGIGNALITTGALLAAIWFWTVVMTPIAIVLIAGVVVSQVRSPAPTAVA